MQLLEASHESDMVLVEQTDRLKHLNLRARNGRE